MFGVGAPLNFSGCGSFASSALRALWGASGSRALFCDRFDGDSCSVLQGDDLKTTRKRAAGAMSGALLRIGEGVRHSC